MLVSIICLVVFLVEVFSIVTGITSFGELFNNIFPCEQHIDNSAPCYIGYDFYLVLSTIVIGLVSAVAWCVQQTYIYYADKKSSKSQK